MAMFHLVTKCAYCIPCLSSEGLSCCDVAYLLNLHVHILRSDVTSEPRRWPKLAQLPHRSDQADVSPLVHPLDYSLV